MAAAIRATGCRKPVFYNIAENPDVYDAILNANVDGLTFQWYPQGLVSGHDAARQFPALRRPVPDSVTAPTSALPARPRWCTSSSRPTLCSR